MKFYKWMLHFIQIFVVLVVLPRVADFVGNLGPASGMHTLIRFAFAATLGLGTISTAYFSGETHAPEYDDEPTNPRERRRREREAVYYTTMLQAAPYARNAMFLFAFLDGGFNLADALRGASANGLFNNGIQGTGLVAVYVTATILFGLAPTILALVLSRVISYVDRIPDDYTRPVSKHELDLLRTVMGNLGLREYRAGEAASLLANEQEEQRALPERTERTSGLVNNGSHAKRDTILAYIQNTYLNENRIPGPSEISRNTGVAKSYCSTVMREYQVPVQES